MDPYATHLPVTTTALEKTAELFPDLPILECGCGDYSTPLFQSLKAGRRHDIYSSDPSWSDKYIDVADRIIFVPEVGSHKWGEFELECPYGLCLMDSEEFVAHRKGHIPRLLDCCKVVVMHDAAAAMLGWAQYDYLYDKLSPKTWIGSNTVDVTQWIK